MNEQVRKALQGYNQKGHRIDLEGREDQARKVNEILGEVLTFEDYSVFKGVDDSGETVDRGFVTYKEYPDRYYWASSSQIEFFRAMEDQLGGGDLLREAMRDDDILMILEKVKRGEGKRGMYFRLTLVDADAEDAMQKNQEELDE